MVLDSQTDPNPVPLINLLPAPYQIVYAVLLLVPSVPLAFAGAFLTLDRTRQFAPMSLATTKEIKEKWRFEGGVGGLLGGFVFGVHLATWMALFILNETSAASLGSIEFLIVWLLPAVGLAVLGVRFKYAALPMIGIGGGAAFSLFVAVACHPSELARDILLGVFSFISAVLCLLPITKTQHASLRFTAAWLGAFGITLSISILAGVSEWTDIWARLWVPWDANWGTSREKGLTAGFIGLAAAGCASDWLLRRQFGECPDEKWDNYLATYAANLPNTHDRAGMFHPSLSFWKRLVNSEPKDPIAFPPDKALLSARVPLSPPPNRAGKLRSQSKNSQPWGGNNFQPLNNRGDDSSGSDSSDEEGHANNGRYIPRPWAKRKDTQAASLSGVTLADAVSSHSKDKVKGAGADMEKGEVAYSDGESVAPPSISGRKKEDRNAPGWTPEFLKRRSTKEGHESGGDNTDKKLSTPASRAQTESPPPGAVPMTPSLMRALDRVSQAQNDAYGGILSRGHTPQASMPGHGGGITTPGAGGGTPGLLKMNMPATPAGYDWGAFWKNVEDKAKDEVPMAKPKATR